MDSGDKNGCGLLGLRTLKSAVSQEWIDELGWFFVCWYKLMKAKSYFNNHQVVVVKNGQGLKGCGALKQGISYKWFDELSRLIEWFLHAYKKTVCLGKICFTSYRPKCSPQFRLQDFFYFNVTAI